MKQFNEKMIIICDEVREILNTEDSLGLDAIVNNLETVNNEVDNQTELIALISTALEGKSVDRSDPPDWNDNSPIVYEKVCYQNGNISMYITENGTCTYKRNIRKDEGSNFYTDQNPKWSYSNFNQIGRTHGVNTPLVINVKQAEIVNVKNPLDEELITKIDSNAFACMSNLKRVRLPDSITEVLQNAFSGCISLTHVNLPEGVTTLGTNVFNNCYSLEEFEIPPLVTELPTSIFNYCHTLKEVRGIERITTIGSGAFGYCTSLNHPIVLNEAITDLANATFRACYNVPSVMFLGTPTGTIGAATFDYCYGISDIYVPWSEGAVANAPWGAINATVHYNTTYDENNNPIV